MIFPNPDPATITGRAQHVINTLCRIEQVLPLGECNGRWQKSFADALALQGTAIEDYTLGELLDLAEHHHQRWLESENNLQMEKIHWCDTGSMEYTQ
ncbi:hypothetical protein A6D6_02665 [Alcanivorax xiamenensis]|uniref:Uncharacterized protein n=1 Tax=Alcanivorax xiamenensis TaxID=1177156 RepID=A0ABQ6Y6C0_9GAMM|nr:hypothetical protein [Alcanivorax xiamenensis]KAF0804901.1 hypothetical protein A6D6_02665 [Alcanivorax xiamenensis]